MTPNEFYLSEIKKFLQSTDAQAGLEAEELENAAVDMVTGTLLHFSQHCADLTEKQAMEVFLKAMYGVVVRSPNFDGWQ